MRVVGHFSRSPLEARSLRRLTFMAVNRLVAAAQFKEGLQSAHLRTRALSLVVGWHFEFCCNRTVALFSCSLSKSRCALAAMCI